MKQFSSDPDISESISLEDLAWWRISFLGFKDDLDVVVFFVCSWWYGTTVKLESLLCFQVNVLRHEVRIVACQHNFWGRSFFHRDRSQVHCPKKAFYSENFCRFKVAILFFHQTIWSTVDIDQVWANRNTQKQPNRRFPHFKMWFSSGNLPKMAWKLGLGIAMSFTLIKWDCPTPKGWLCR